jgi:hypothetical protein
MLLDTQNVRAEMPAEIDQLGIAGAAAQTRMVSAGEFWPSRQELSRELKYMARARIPEFESYMPSHAVRSPWASGPATNTGTLHTLGPKSEGRLRKRPRSGLTAWKKSPSRSPWGLSSTSRKSGPWLQRPAHHSDQEARATLIWRDYRRCGHERIEQFCSDVASSRGLTLSQ